MHRNECFHGDAHSNIVSPRSMEELMGSPRSRYAHSVLYRGHRSPTAFLQISHINQLSIAAHHITYSRDFQHKPYREAPGCTAKRGKAINFLERRQKQLYRWIKGNAQVRLGARMNKFPFPSTTARQNIPIYMAISTFATFSTFSTFSSYPCMLKLYSGLSHEWPVKGSSSSTTHVLKAIRLVLRLCGKSEQLTIPASYDWVSQSTTARVQSDLPILCRNWSSLGKISFYNFNPPSSMSSNGMFQHSVLHVYHLVRRYETST
jgi:hypothetical protein